MNATLVVRALYRHTEHHENRPTRLTTTLFTCRQRAEPLRTRFALVTRCSHPVERSDCNDYLMVYMENKTVGKSENVWCCRREYATQCSHPVERSNCNDYLMVYMENKTVGTSENVWCCRREYTT